MNPARFATLASGAANAATFVCGVSRYAVGSPTAFFRLLETTFQILPVSGSMFCCASDSRVNSVALE